MYVDYIHLRERNWTAQKHMDVIKQMTDAGIPSQKIIVNDRLDIAIVGKTAGVQLTSHSLDVVDVKHHYPHLHVGCSVHSVENAVKKAKTGANYVMYGHVFETNSKAGLAPRGVSKLKKVVHSVPIPVIAIGGITPNRVSSIINAGASGIAVMSGIF